MKVLNYFQLILLEVVIMVLGCHHVRELWEGLGTLRSIRENQAMFQNIKENPGTFKFFVVLFQNADIFQTQPQPAEFKNSQILLPCMSCCSVQSF